MEFYLSNVLILGASGMLGRMVSYVFSDISSNKLFITSRKEDSFINNLNGEVISFDIFNDDFEELCNKINPDYVVNCIGAIKPTISDDNKSISNAIKTNSLFPLDITNVSLKKGITYFQIGTDCVFSGKTGKYDETSFTDADDVYGMSKVVGEVKASNKIITRASIIGPEPGEGKSLLNWFLNTKDEAVNGFKNHHWNGITTLNYAKIVNGMIEENYKNDGLLHLIPKNIVNKYELLKLFSEYFDKEIVINSVEADVQIDRTLETNNPEINELIWKLGGYSSVQTIQENIEELSLFEGTNKILESA